MKVFRVCYKCSNVTFGPDYLWIIAENFKNVEEVAKSTKPSNAGDTEEVTKGKEEKVEKKFDSEFWGGRI